MVGIIAAVGIVAVSGVITYEFEEKIDHIRIRREDRSKEQLIKKTKNQQPKNW